MGEVIGNMDRYIELKSAVTTKTAMGAPQKTYTHYKYNWAARRSSGMSPESYVNNRLVTAPRYIYRIHRDDSVTESMQLIDDGDTYNILAVDLISRLFIEILAEKIVE